MNCSIDKKLYLDVKQKLGAAFSKYSLEEYAPKIYNAAIKKQSAEIALSVVASMPRMTLELISEDISIAKSLQNIYSDKSIAKIKEDLYKQSVLFETDLNNVIEFLGLGNDVKAQLEALRSENPVSIQEAFKSSLSKDIASLVTLDESNLNIPIESVNKILGVRLDNSLYGNIKLLESIYDLMFASDGTKQSFLTEKLNEALNQHQGLITENATDKEKLQVLARLNKIGLATNNMFSKFAKSIKGFKVVSEDKGITFYPAKKTQRIDFKSDSLAIKSFLDNAGGYNLYRTTIQDIIKKMYISSNSISFDRNNNPILGKNPFEVFQKVMQENSILSDEEMEAYRNYTENAITPPESIREKILGYHILQAKMLPLFFDSYSSFATTIEFDKDLEKGLEEQDDKDESERYVESVSYDKNVVYKANKLVKAHLNNISLLSLKIVNGNLVISNSKDKENLNSGILTEHIYSLKERAYNEMKKDASLSFEESLKKEILKEVGNEKRVSNTKVSYLMSYYVHFFGVPESLNRNRYVNTQEKLQGLEGSIKTTTPVIAEGDVFSFETMIEKITSRVSKGSYLDENIFEGEIPKSVYANYLNNLAKSKAVINSYFLTLRKENIAVINGKGVKVFKQGQEARNEERFSFVKKVQQAVVRPEKEVLTEFDKNLAGGITDPASIQVYKVGKAIKALQELSFNIAPIMGQRGDNIEPIGITITKKDGSLESMEFKFFAGTQKGNEIFSRRITNLITRKRVDSNGNIIERTVEKEAIEYLNQFTKADIEVLSKYAGVETDFDMAFLFDEDGNSIDTEAISTIGQNLLRTALTAASDGFYFRFDKQGGLKSYSENISPQQALFLDTRATVLDHPDALLNTTTTFTKLDKGTVRSETDRIIVVNTVANYLLDDATGTSSKRYNVIKSPSLKRAIASVEYSFLGEVYNDLGDSKTYEELNMEERIALMLRLNEDGHSFGITPSNKNTNYVIKGNIDERYLHLALAEDFSQNVSDYLSLQGEQGYSIPFEDINDDNIQGRKDAVNRFLSKIKESDISGLGFQADVHYSVKPDSRLSISSKSLQVINRTEEQIEEIKKQDYEDFIELVKNEARPEILKTITDRDTFWKEELYYTRRSYALDAFIKFGHPNTIQDNIQLSKRIILAQTKHSIGDSSIPQGIERTLGIAVAQDRTYREEYPAKTQYEILLDIAKENGASKVDSSDIAEAVTGDALSFQTMLGQMQTVASFGKKIVKGTEASVDPITHTASFGKTSIVALTNELLYTYGSDSLQTLEKRMLGDILYNNLNDIREYKIASLPKGQNRYSKEYIDWLNGHNDYQQLYNEYAALREAYENLKIEGVTKKQLIETANLYVANRIPSKRYQRDILNDLMQDDIAKEYLESRKGFTFLLENRSAQKTKVGILENNFTDSSRLEGYQVDANSYGEVTDIVNQAKKGFIAQPSQSNYIITQGNNTTSEDVKTLFENNRNIISQGKERVARELQADERGIVQPENIQAAEQKILDKVAENLIASEDASNKVSISQDAKASINNPLLEKAAFEDMSRYIKRDTSSKKVLGIRSVIIAGTGIVKLLRMRDGNTMTTLQALREGILIDSRYNSVEGLQVLRDHRGLPTNYYYSPERTNIGILDNLQPSRFVKESEIDGMLLEEVILDKRILTQLSTLQGKELESYMESNSIVRRPTEVLLPNLYKDLIGEGAVDEILKEGSNYFLKKIASQNKRATREELSQAAEESFAAFSELINNILGTRIPTTGFNSIQDMKIVGFYDSADNSIIIPFEPLYSSGADNDGDMVANEIIELEKNDTIKGAFRVKENSLSTINVRAKKGVYGNTENTLRSISPINFDSYKAAAKKKETPVMKKANAAAMLISQKTNLGSQKLTGIAVKFSEVYHLYQYILKNKPELQANANFSYTINGITYQADSIQESIDGFEIAKLIEEYSNLLLDDTKINASGLLNMNRVTLPVINYMLMYGVPMEKIQEFVTSPEIVETARLLMVETSDNVLRNDVKSKKETEVRKSLLNKYTEKELENINSFFSLKEKSEVVLEQGRKILSLSNTKTTMDDYVKNIENFLNSLDLSLLELLTKMQDDNSKVNIQSYVEQKVSDAFNSKEGNEKLPYALYLEIPYIKESINALLYDLQLKQNFFPAMQDKTLAAAKDVLQNTDNNGNVKMANIIKQKKGFSRYFEFVQRIKAIEFLNNKGNLSSMVGEQYVNNPDSAFNEVINKLNAFDLSNPEQRREAYNATIELANMLITKRKDEDGYKLGGFLAVTSSSLGEPMIIIKALRGYSMNNHLALREAFDELSYSTEGKYIAQAMLLSALLRKKLISTANDGMWAMFDPESLRDYNDFLLSSKEIKNTANFDFRFFIENPYLAPQMKEDGGILNQRNSKVFVTWDSLSKGYSVTSPSGQKIKFSSNSQINNSDGSYITLASPKNAQALPITKGDTEINEESPSIKSNAEENTVFQLSQKLIAPKRKTFNAKTIMHRGLLHLQEKLKRAGINVVIENNPTGLYKGRLEGTTVYLNEALITEDTLFHELSHIYLGMIAKAYPEQFANIKEILLQHPLYEQTRQEYGSIYNNNQDKIIEETLAKMIGLRSFKLFERTELPSLTNKIISFFENILDNIIRVFKEVLGVKSDYDINNQRLYDFVYSIANDIINAETDIPLEDNIRFDIAYQLAGGKELSLREGITKIGGTSGNLDDAYIEAVTNKALTQLSASPTATINFFGFQGVSMQDLENKELITTLIKENEKNVILSANQFYRGNPSLSKEQNLEMMKEAIKANEEKGNYVHRLIPDFNSDTDKLIFFGDSSSSNVGLSTEDIAIKELIEKSKLFNEGNYAIKVRTVRLNNGKTIKSAQLIAFTSKGLGASSKAKSIIKNIIGEKRGFFSAISSTLKQAGLGVKLDDGIKSGISIELSTMAMLLKQSFPNIQIDEMNIAKINGDKGIGDIQTVFPNDVLPSLASIAKLKESKESFPKEVLNLWSDAKINNPSLYVSDYIASLYNNLTSKGITNIITDIENYVLDTDDKQQSHQKLRLALLKRSDDIRKSLKLAGEEALLNDIEYQNLIRAINYLDNKGKDGFNSVSDMSVLEKVVSIEGETKNPYYQWIYAKFTEKQRVLKDRFMRRMNPIGRDFKRYVEWYKKNNPISLTASLTDYEGAYYKSLKKYQKQIINGKEINIDTYTLLSPTDSEWNDLSKEQRDFIIKVDKHIKEMLVNAYLNQKGLYKKAERDAKMPEAVAFVNAKHKFGMLPVMRGDAGLNLLRGDINSYLDNSYELMVNRQKYYDNEVQKNYEELSNFMFSQLISVDANGSKSRRELIGYDLESGTYDPTINSLVEQNLLRTISYFQMGISKKELMDEVVTIYNVARHLVKLRELKTGISQKNTLDYMDTIVKGKLFGEKVKFSDDKTVRRFEQSLMAVGGISNSMALGFNFLSNIGQTFSQYFSILVNATNEAISKTGKMISVSDMAEAHKEIAEPKKALMIAEHLQLLSMDEFALISSKFFTGAEDSRMADQKVLDASTLTLGDKVGDYMTKLLLMVAIMKKEGTYDAYEVVEEDGRSSVKYNGSKDKRTALEKEILAKKLVEEGYIESNENSTSAYTATDLRRMSLIFARVLSAVNENQTSYMQHIPFLKALGKFQMYLVPKLINIFKAEGTNFNMATLEMQDGKVIEVYQHETGIMNSIVKMAGLALHYKGDFSSIKANMTSNQLDRVNYAITSLAYTLLGYAAKRLLGEEEERKKKWNEKDLRMFRIIDGIINDISIYKNVFSLSDRIENPFIALSILKRLSGAVVDMITLDFDAGTKGLVKSIGVLKTIDFFAGWTRDQDLRQELKDRSRRAKRYIGIEED